MWRWTDGTLMEKYVSGNSIGNGPDNKIMSPVIASIAYRQGRNKYCVKYFKNTFEFVKQICRKIKP